MRFFNHTLLCSLAITFMMVTVTMAAGTFTPLENPSFTDASMPGGNGQWILTPDQGGVTVRVTDVYSSAPASIKLVGPAGSHAPYSNFHNAFYVADINPSTGSGWPVPMTLSCKTKLVSGTAYLGYAIVIFDANTTGHIPWVFMGDMGYVSYPISNAATDWTDFNQTTDIAAQSDTGETITLKDKVLQQIKAQSINKPTIVIDVVGYVKSGTVYFDDFSLVQTNSSALGPVSGSAALQISNQIKIWRNMAKFNQTTPYTIYIQNAQGRTVSSTSGTNSMVLIPQENLASGAYLLTVKTRLFGTLTECRIIGK